MKNFDEVKTQKSFPELALERAMSTVIVSPAKPSTPSLSPSGLGCQRAAAFKLSGAMCREDTETYESSLAAAMGSFVHERLQKFMSKSNIWVNVQDYIVEHPELNLRLREHQRSDGEVSLEFSGERQGTHVPPFTFQCDGLVKIEGEYYLIEIKTETETAWQKRGAPNPKHQEQGRAYAFLYGVRNILWVYASRESFGTHRKIYLQTIKDSEIYAFSSLITGIGAAVESKSISSLPKAKDCKYCAFIDLCKKLDKSAN